MAWSTNKAIQGLISGGVAAAPSGNPYLIAASSIGNAALSGLSGPEKPDFTKYRRAVNRIGRGVRSRARRDAAEVGSQLGSSLARRGLNQSALGAGIAAGNQRRILERAGDYENRLKTQAELDIAQAQTAADLADREELRRDWGNLATAGIIAADRYAHAQQNPQAAQGTETLADVLAKLRGEVPPSTAQGGGSGASVIVGRQADGTPIYGLRPGTVNGQYVLRGYDQRTGQPVWARLPIQGPIERPADNRSAVPSVPGTDLSLQGIHGRSSLNSNNQGSVLGQDPNQPLVDVNVPPPPGGDLGVTPPNLDITPQGIHERQTQRESERYPQLGELGQYAQNLENRIAQRQSGVDTEPGALGTSGTASPVGDATVNPRTGHITPKDSGVSFAPTSQTGQMYTSNPAMTTYLADSLTGNWEELMEILQPPTAA